MGFEPSTKLVLKELKAEGLSLIRGETEVCIEECNPKYAKNIDIKYFVQEAQKIKIEVYEVDDDNDETPLEELRCLGIAEFMIPELLKGEGNILTVPLKLNKKKTGGEATIMYELLKKSAKIKMMQLSAQITLSAKTETDFYYRLYRSIAVLPQATLLSIPEQSLDSLEECNRKKSIDNLVLVYDSKFGSLNHDETCYNWKDMKELFSKISLEDPNLPLSIEVGIKKSPEGGEENSVDSQLAIKHFSVDKFKKEGVSFQIESQAIQYGTFNINSIDVYDEFKFVDYIQSGASLQLCVSIDYTLSNVRESVNRNYHTTDLENNPYALILRALGNAILCFDSSRRIPVIGNGATIPKIGRSYCFALTGSIFEPEVVGLSSVFELYLNALSKVRLSGPTYFSQVLEYFGDLVEQSLKVPFSESLHYYVVAVLADGSPIDMEETLDQ